MSKIDGSRSDIDGGVGFASALRAPVGQDAIRTQLRGLIAVALRAAETRCRHGYGPGPVGTLDACASCIADALTELFPEVTREELFIESFSGEETPAAEAGGVSHVRFVLRTAPRAVGGGEADQPNAPDLDPAGTRQEGDTE